MGTPHTILVALLAVSGCFAASAQEPTSTSNGAPANSPAAAGAIAAPSTTPLPASATHTTVVATAAAPGPAIDPKAAVQSVFSMFMPNPAVNVEATGKPLPSTGSWGVQTQFPAGVPKPCVQARVPCIKVVYRVPEANVVCDWTLGYIAVVEPQPDGSIKHAMHELVLDENEAAAHYTLRKAWSKGDTMPHPSAGHAPDYPAIARDAHVGGLVIARLIVGPEGAVKSVNITSGPKMLHDAVVAAVRQWKFDPLAIGQQPTSFQLDESFSYNPGKPDMTAGMDPSGKVIMQENDPHYALGFRSDGASSGKWQSCSSGGCVSVAPSTPQ